MTIPKKSQACPRLRTAALGSYFCRSLPTRYVANALGKLVFDSLYQSLKITYRALEIQIQNPYYKQTHWKKFYFQNWKLDFQGLVLVVPVQSSAILMPFFMTTDFESITHQWKIYDPSLLNVSSWWAFIWLSRSREIYMDHCILFLSAVYTLYFQNRNIDHISFKILCFTTSITLFYSSVDGQSLK